VQQQWKPGEVATERFTSEVYVAQDTEQFDLFESGDREQRARVRIRQAARRYGESELATGVELDAKTLGNQLARRKRDDKSNSIWKLNEDAVLRLFFSDRRLREELLELVDEEIADAEVLRPEDALRDIVAKARSGEWGRAASEEITTVYRKVKRSGK
jgi:hypothetical protein